MDFNSAGEESIAPTVYWNLSGRRYEQRPELKLCALYSYMYNTEPDHT